MVSRAEVILIASASLFTCLVMNSACQLGLQWDPSAKIPLHATPCELGFPTSWRPHPSMSQETNRSCMAFLNLDSISFPLHFTVYKDICKSNSYLKVKELESLPLNEEECCLKTNKQKTPDGKF